MTPTAYEAMRQALADLPASAVVAGPEEARDLAYAIGGAGTGERIESPEITAKLVA